MTSAKNTNAIQWETTSNWIPTGLVHSGTEMELSNDTQTQSGVIGSLIADSMLTCLSDSNSASCSNSSQLWNGNGKANTNSGEI